MLLLLKRVAARGGSSASRRVTAGDPAVHDPDEMSVEACDTVVAADRHVLGYELPARRGFAPTGGGEPVPATGKRCQGSGGSVCADRGFARLFGEKDGRGERLADRPDPCHNAKRTLVMGGEIRERSDGGLLVATAEDPNACGLFYRRHMTAVLAYMT